jgi:hypothetical protein
LQVYSFSSSGGRLHNEVAKIASIRECLERASERRWRRRKEKDFKLFLHCVIVFDIAANIHFKLAFEGKLTREWKEVKEMRE